MDSSKNFVFCDKVEKVLCLQNIKIEESVDRDQTVYTVRLHGMSWSLLLTNY